MEGLGKILLERIEREGIDNLASIAASSGLKIEEFEMFEIEESPILSFFYSLNGPEEQWKSLVEPALRYDQETFCRIVLYIRDVRGEFGRRDMVRDITEVVVDTIKKDKKFLYALGKLIVQLPLFGRWDDILWLLEIADGSPWKEFLVEHVRNQLWDDYRSAAPSLLAKWMPSENATSKRTKRLARKWRRALGLHPRKYRKMLVSIRKKIGLIENRLHSSEIGCSYDKIPSLAKRKYWARIGKDFLRNWDSISEEPQRRENSNLALAFNSPPLLVFYLRRYKGVRSKEDLLLSYWHHISLPEDMRKMAVYVDGDWDMDEKVHFQGRSPRAYDIGISLGLLTSRSNASFFGETYLGTSREGIEISPEGVVQSSTYPNSWRNQELDIEELYDFVFEKQKQLPREEQLERLLVVTRIDYKSRGVSDDYLQKNKKRFLEAGLKWPKLLYWDLDDYSKARPFDEMAYQILLYGLTPTLYHTLLVDDDLSPTKMMEKALPDFL